MIIESLNFVVAENTILEYASRMFDQIFFIAPLFRLSENKAKAGGKYYTYYFTPESSLPIMRSVHAVELASVR